MSKKLKLSPWKSVKKPPSKHKPGIYEAKCNQTGCEWKYHFSWWDGAQFCGLWRTKALAYKNMDVSPDNSMTAWRGVLK